MVQVHNTVVQERGDAVNKV